MYTMVAPTVSYHAECCQNDFPLIRPPVLLHCTVRTVLVLTVLTNCFMLVVGYPEPTGVQPARITGTVLVTCRGIGLCHTSYTFSQRS